MIWSKAKNVDDRGLRRALWEFKSDRGNLESALTLIPLMILFLSVAQVAISVYAKGIFKMSQWALSSLGKTKGTIVNIVSNASHMPMRCSAAYNASKGAAHILTLQLARELSPDVTVFGISPNKLAGTGMSRDIERQVCEQRGWTPEQAAKYQLAALLPGVETPPERVAEFIAFLLSDRERHRYLAGCVIPYGA